MTPILRTIKVCEYDFSAFESKKDSCIFAIAFYYIIYMVGVISRVLCFVSFILVSLVVSAQDGDEVIKTVQLPETVVLADGMTIEEYLIKQVLDSAKPLKKHIDELDYSVRCQLEKDIDLKKIPHRRTITFVARLAGYGKIVSALMEHKHFGITMTEDISFRKGKIKTSNARMVEMLQPLKEKQIKSFLKHDGMMSANVFDKFYDKVRDKAKDLQKKYKNKKETGMKCVGSYTTDNRKMYIVRLDSMEVHIAEGCWQISKLSYSEGQNYMHYDFSEVRPNLYLVKSGRAKFYLDKKKWPKGFVSMKMDYVYK